MLVFPLLCVSNNVLLSRYNEPTHVKHLKLDILPKIANEVNATDIALELNEYVTDVDAEMARHAIRAIAEIAVRLPTAAERIVDMLLDLLQLEVDYVRSETVVVMQDLLRKYPQRAPAVIPALHRCLKQIEEPEGKASVIWMIGEYGQLIDEAPYLLEPVIDSLSATEADIVKCEVSQHATASPPLAPLKCIGAAPHSYHEVVLQAAT